MKRSIKRPASASRLLNEELLRKRLGFNGLIVSDASEMAGLTSFVPLVQSKVDLLVNGCDMVLFTRDLPRDIANIKAALESGYLPRARFDMALARVLGMKAALKLHKARDIGPRPARLAAMTAPALQARALKVRLGDRQVLGGLSLALPAGRWTAIVGPTGAGKSTLLRALAGMESGAGVQGGRVVDDMVTLPDLAPTFLQAVERNSTGHFWIFLSSSGSSTMATAKVSRQCAWPSARRCQQCIYEAVERLPPSWLSCPQHLQPGPVRSTDDPNKGIITRGKTLHSPARAVHFSSSGENTGQPIPRRR